MGYLIYPKKKLKQPKELYKERSNRKNCENEKIFQSYNKKFSISIETFHAWWIYDTNYEFILIRNKNLLHFKLCLQLAFEDNLCLFGCFFFRTISYHYLSLLTYEYYKKDKMLFYEINLI